MMKEILYKLFGIEDFPCKTCEVLREQLAFVNEEKRHLLETVLDKNKPEVTVQKEHEPIKPTFIPWRVRQQMLENEDREKARLIKSNEDLEKDLGVGEVNAAES